MKRRSFILGSSTLACANVSFAALTPKGSAAEIGDYILLHALLPKDVKALSHGLPSPSTRPVLMQTARDDFKHGRILSIDDWYISETEGRICALAALGVDCIEGLS